MLDKWEIVYKDLLKKQRKYGLLLYHYVNAGIVISKAIIQTPYNEHANQYTLQYTVF